MPNSDLKQGGFCPEKVERQTPPENINFETVINDNRKEIELHKEVVGTFDVLAVEPVRKRQDQFAAWG